jgi:DEAD/DEAH box helicase domain-containing protein
MGIQSVVDFMERKFAPQIAARSVLEASGGEFEPLPDDLDPRLAEALRRSGLNQLYSHQREAFDTIRQGQDTVLVSRTASGKTLSFLLPILHDYLQADAPFGVMLLYPTKAL